jgi:hypothetical protein
MFMARISSRIARSFIAATILAGSLASCGSDLLDSISHTWTLQTIGNVQLPATVPNSSPTVIITSGTATTSGNGTYSFTFNGTTGGTEGVVGSDQGNWSISNSTFLFRSTQGIPNYIAATNDTSMRVSLSGQVVHSSDQTIPMVFSQTQ